ncbi:serine/threonine-protein kinase [Streptomyces collinus]|uniref:serine/threonine-protein kinase n=1 Tax=Streptomyces collinus TaxID=42684 RepID=UPI0033F75E43
MAKMGDAAGRAIAGRYRLLSSLGAGGMGRVWLAHDQDLDCKVVLKEVAVPPDLPESELHARIARARGEARHSARLRGNRHVVTVYDCLIDDGLPWIVMEYVPGARDLEDVIRESGALSATDTARLGLALLDALMAGHQLGILHRDVKPSNILVTVQEPRGARPSRIGRVLLSDYGISLQRDAGEPRLTAASGIVGTPGFLAPERARGAEPTPESDLFSLGATLYYAVEGHGPFDHNSYVATLTALLTEDPAPPRRADDLAPVLLKLLVKDPAHRLTADDATSLLRELTRETARAPQQTITDVPEPIEQTPTPQPLPTPPQLESSKPTPAPHPWRKSRRNMALIGAALLAVGMGAWAVVAGLDGSHKPSASPMNTPTGAVMPYGEAVGLTRELERGDCVNAVWANKKFVGLPNVGRTDCINSTHSGQVVDTDSASSLGDAQKNGESRCKDLLADTVNAMGDARAYALTPSKEGWDSGVHRTACLIFDKTTDISGNVGQFRKIGEQIGLENSQTGDCYNYKETKTETISYLADCGTPHDAQLVGWVPAPTGMTFQSISAGAAPSTLCENRYGSKYGTASRELLGYYANDETLWKNGFRNVECDVHATGGQKLTSSVIAQPTSAASSR